MTEDEKEAYRLYESGVKPSYSCSIDEVTTTCGYGELDSAGNFQYPLRINHETLEVLERSDVELLKNMIEGSQGDI